jgi:hypothetical protein
MKSFDQTFSKVCGVLGQSPESRPQARNILNGISIREANYWFIFFVPAVSKKRTERIFSHNIPTKQATLEIQGRLSFASLILLQAPAFPRLSVHR